MNARVLLTGLLFEPNVTRASLPLGAKARLLYGPERMGICDGTKMQVGDVWKIEEIRRTSSMRMKLYTNIAILRDHINNPKVVDMRDIEVV